MRRLSVLYVVALCVCAIMCNPVNSLSSYTCCLSVYGGNKEKTNYKVYFYERTKPYIRHIKMSNEKSISFIFLFLIIATATSFAQLGQQNTFGQQGQNGGIIGNLLGKCFNHHFCIRTFNTLCKLCSLFYNQQILLFNSEKYLKTKCGHGIRYWTLSLCSNE
jgi:hypothetical protein